MNEIHAALQKEHRPLLKSRGVRAHIASRLAAGTEVGWLGQSFTDVRALRQVFAVDNWLKWIREMRLSGIPAESRGTGRNNTRPFFSFVNFHSKRAEEIISCE